MVNGVENKDSPECVSLTEDWLIFLEESRTCGGQHGQPTRHPLHKTTPPPMPRPHIPAPIFPHFQEKALNPCRHVVVRCILPTTSPLLNFQQPLKLPLRRQPQ